MTLLYTPLNQLATTVGTAYTAASGSLVLATGYGATIAAAISAQGAQRSRRPTRSGCRSSRPRTPADRADRGDISAPSSK